ncbi:MAG: hypothetical protein KIH08_15030 [Candidatus Freyarchaeota archaeon]|nr:hypothetical protein [Candidatus Jordarchaeia archaeon]MBS7270124.1 hypothetical protein [Candidatus Jordarchaeia archaeon]MBS7280701.1 hypothetical protein [Candidatus Jordarchaeia archaeon]
MERINASYEQVDFNTILDIALSGIKIIEDKIYGPVYPRLVKRYAMQFLCNKLNIEVPEGSEDWDWPRISEYIDKNLEAYPMGYTAFSYAMAKTEAVLQGKTGVSNRVSINELIKSIKNRFKEIQQASDFISCFKQAIEKVVALKVMPPNAFYKIENEKVIKLEVNACVYKDICEAFIKESVRKYDGSTVCSVGRMITTYIELELGPNYDYKLEKFASPNCEVTIIQID